MPSSFARVKMKTQHDQIVRYCLIVALNRIYMIWFSIFCAALSPPQNLIAKTFIPQFKIISVNPVPIFSLNESHLSD